MYAPDPTIHVLLYRTCAPVSLMCISHLYISHLDSTLSIPIHRPKQTPRDCVSGRNTCFRGRGQAEVYNTIPRKLGRLSCWSIVFLLCTRHPPLLLQNHMTTPTQASHICISFCASKSKQTADNKTSFAQ